MHESIPIIIWGIAIAGILIYSVARPIVATGDKCVTNSAQSDSIDKWR